MGKGLWIGIIVVVLLLVVGGYALMQGLTPEPVQKAPASGTESSAQNTAAPANAESSVASDEELYGVEDSNIDDSVILSDEAVIDAPQ